MNREFIGNFLNHKSDQPKIRENSTTLSSIRSWGSSSEEDIHPPDFHTWLESFPDYRIIVNESESDSEQNNELSFLVSGTQNISGARLLSPLFIEYQKNLNRNLYFPLDLLEDSLISTKNIPIDINSRIYTELNNIYSICDEVYFEDGFENPITRGIQKLHYRYGSRTFSIISEYIESTSLKDIYIAETLKYLGNIIDIDSELIRLYILVKYLDRGSIQIRDAAALGLSFIDNPLAISFLKKALKIAQSKFIIESYTQIIEQLEKTKLALSSKENI